MANFPCPQLITNLVAGEDLSALQYRPMRLTSAGSVFADTSLTGDKTIGILMNAPTIGQVCEIATVGGGAKALAGGTIAAGDPVTASSVGRVVKATSGKDVIGYALESAVSGDIFGILITSECAKSSVQELTESGAVSDLVQSIELNHASVVVAATIADAADHQGLLIVKNTSASGTAAHTLTLTSGTFDGTNNVATLNAPNEALAVFIDSSGDGTVLANVGSVALS